jgi:4-oxalocrotonate tautomerase
MPIVQITMFEGRDEETKARLAREVADAVAEATGNSLDDVHVLFDEKPRAAWARGLTLASRRPPRSREGLVRADYASVSRIRYEPATEEEYLELRRDVINPGMATQEGFVSSLLLRPHDRSDEYLLVNKWTSEEASRRYSSGAVHDGLKEKALKLLPEPLRTFGADVVHLD